MSGEDRTRSEEYEVVLEKLFTLSTAYKKFLGINEESLRKLRAQKDKILSRREEVVFKVLDSLLANDEILEIIKRTGLTKERASQLFKYSYTLFLEGGYDKEHVQKLFRIGLAHARIQVPERLMILTAGAFLREALRSLGKVDVSKDVFPVLSNCVFWNLCLMLESYELSRRLSLLKATGISEKLYERLISLKAKEIYEKMIKFVHSKIGVKPKPQENFLDF